MSKLILMIGLPGSGKSTRAKEMCELAAEQELSYAVCSTDSYFVVNGIYKWDPRLLFENHGRNFRAACLEMKRGTDVVIIDNTNITRDVRQKYIDAAKSFGYEVEEVVIGEFTEKAIQLYASRNLHNVPIESIRKMAQKYLAEQNAAN